MCFYSIRFKVNKGWSKALLLFMPIRLVSKKRMVFLNHNTLKKHCHEKSSLPFSL